VDSLKFSACPLSPRLFNSARKEKHTKRTCTGAISLLIIVTIPFVFIPSVALAIEYTFTTIGVPAATLTEAFGINDAGQVLGVCAQSGSDHGLLLTPIPASITVVLDIEPESINPESKGKIPVAMFSTENFNASTQIHPRSLTSGHTNCQRTEVGLQ
jgi:hypothetical protein